MRQDDKMNTRKGGLLFLKRKADHHSAFSHEELLSANKKYRLESKPEELASLFPKVKTMKIDNTKLSPEVVSQNIITTFQLDSKKGPNPLS